MGYGLRSHTGSSGGVRKRKRKMRDIVLTGGSDRGTNQTRRRVGMNATR